MGIVNVEIHCGAAGFGRIANFGRPIRPRNEAFEMSAKNAAPPSTANRLGGIREFREKRQHMGDH